MSVKRYKQVFTLMKGLGLLTVTRYAKLTSGGYMPLTVERISEPGAEGEYDLSLCHYGEQNGDLMRDPEMVVRIFPETRVAVPIYFRNDYVGIEQSDEVLGLPNTVEFLISWLRTLDDQGFVCLGDTDTGGNPLSGDDDLSDVSTSRLVEELVKREGVTEFTAPDPDHGYEVVIFSDIPNAKTEHQMLETGPARILVVID